MATFFGIVISTKGNMAGSGLLLLAYGAVCFAVGAGVGGVNITRWAWKPFVL